jgi:hypothetical protein
MMRPAKLPFWVECAALAMADFQVDLWAMRPEDRTAVLVAALDAELLADHPDKIEAFVEAAVHQKWRAIKDERRQRWKGLK